jgi:hypothetical protein
MQISKYEHNYKTSNISVVCSAYTQNTKKKTIIKLWRTSSTPTLFFEDSTMTLDYHNNFKPHASN